MEGPINLHPTSSTFIEDYKRYKAKQHEIWINNTIEVQRLVSDGNGGTRVVNIRRPKPIEAVIQPYLPPEPLGEYYSPRELQAIQLTNEAQQIIESRNTLLLKAEARLQALQGKYRTNRSQRYRYINLKRSVARLRQAAEEHHEIKPKTSHHGEPTKH